MSEVVKKKNRVRVYEARLKGVDKAARMNLKILIVARARSDAKNHALFHIEQLKKILHGSFWELGTVREVKSDAVIFVPVPKILTT